MRGFCINPFTEEELLEIIKEEGITIGAVQQLVGLIKDGLISEEDAARRMGKSLSDFKSCVDTYCS